MTTIYLHIGTPKTGTTTLQKFLCDNREKLLEKEYLYPLSGMISTQNITGLYSHHGLAKACVNMYDPKSPAVKDSRSEWKKSWEDLKKEIKMIKPQNVIISSEFFTGIKEFYNPDMISLTRKILEEYETKIVIYVRKQDYFFRSLYSEYAKSPLPNKVSNHLYENSSNKNIMRMREFIEQLKYQANYYSILELWKNSFGIKNIIVRPFEKEQMKNGSIVDDFLDIINLKCDKSDINFNSSNFQNISYSGKIIKLINLIESISQIRRLPEGKYWYLYTKFSFFRMDSRIELATFLSRFIPDFLVSE